MSTAEVIAETAAHFIPRRFLRNGHLQTIAGNFLPRKYLLPPAEAMLVEVEGPVGGYGSTFVRCDCNWQPLEVRSQRPTVVLVHGLEGSSNSQYMLGNAARAWAAGWNAVRMNMRSCGGTDELAPTIYHSGRSVDVGHVVEEIIRLHQIQFIALIGYSMGGNMVLKYAGELGRSAPRQLKAVVGISPLMDLAISSAALHRPQNRIYERRFLSRMVRHFRRKTELFPNLYSANGLEKIRTMRMFDDEIVARYADFASADDYYARVSSSNVAGALALPTFIIHSLDDPFIKMLPETGAKLRSNRNVTFIETERGGHCAFLAAADGYDGYWAEKRLFEFLQTTAAS